MHFQCVAAAAERGYNVLSFDGPGQAGAVYRQRLVFRPDWENVVGPVIDYALTLPGVDGAKIVLWGLSMGGELAPRAAAFEHRLAALVCVDGLYDMGVVVLGQATAIPDFERRLRADGEDPDLDAEIARLMAASPTVRWAATELEAQGCMGSPVTVVGGANSAGQAALYLAGRGRLPARRGRSGRASAPPTGGAERPRWRKRRCLGRAARRPADLRPGAHRVRQRRGARPARQHHSRGR